MKRLLRPFRTCSVSLDERQKTETPPGEKTMMTMREDKARQLGFVSSPAIRVNGRDIAPELRESSCASCGEACGCEGGIDCRVWVYQGNEYTAAPAPMIADALLAAVYGKEEIGTPPAAAVPGNLKRFFAKANSSCCSAEEQAVCCAPERKPTCCAPVEAVEPAGCGCR